ncbi:MAG TPA: DNA polymerase III subunit gamma/tau [Acidobacteriota bacterium]|nr:DNA polymerase III subunit gamma/tau [Acidobacteriota bacterium]
MSYLVFARKYRPQTFESVVAQEHVTRTLRNALKNDRIGSAYLFCGPRGTGKTTVARILAKATNCVNGPTETPCGECPACVEITAGSSLDVLEIDAASNTGVDDIRTLRENVRYLPTGGKKRIYIIDEVHRLSGSAFDALLKTLEEPPPHVIFVFATTEPLKVPETILSRTQRFDFRRVSVDDLASHLKSIARQENLRVDEASLNLLARKADGSVRDALSLLDQIAAFAGDNISEIDVVSALGLVDRRFLFKFVTSVAKADKAEALHLIKELFEGGVDVGDFVAELLDHLRSLLVLATDENAAELLNLPDAELNEYKTQAVDFTVGDVLRLMKMVADLNADLRSGLDQRLLLEITAVKMAELESTVRLEEVLARISSDAEAPGAAPAEDTGQPDIFAEPSQKKNPLGRAAGQPPVPDETRPTADPSAYSRSINLAQVKAGWENFLAYLRNDNRMLASQLSMAVIRSVQDNELVLVFSGAVEPSLQLVSKPENSGLITRLLREHYKANLRLTVERDRNNSQPAGDHDEGPSAGINSGDLVKRSPRLKKLLKLVDGEIIGVKKIQ